MTALIKRAAACMGGFDRFLKLSLARNADWWAQAHPTIPALIAAADPVVAAEICRLFLSLSLSLKADGWARAHPTVADLDRCH